LTANYVPRDDALVQKAIKKDPEALRSFVTAGKTNNWKKVDGTADAWKEEDKTQFLSQFGDNYDLQMDEPANQDRLVDVLKHLVGLGVKGFRLSNAKHFIISKDLNDESPLTTIKENPYEKQTHTKTTYLQGLGDVMNVFTKAVHSADSEAFLTIDDGDSGHNFVFVMDNTTRYGFDLPRFNFLTHFFEHATPVHKEVPKQLFNGFDALKDTVDMLNLWMQVAYSPDFSKSIGLGGSAYNMFMSLLPGVQVVPFETLNYAGNKTDTMKKLEEARESPVFQFGNFSYMMSSNEDAFAYAR
jgi:solute carrier family 3, member 2